MAPVAVQSMWSMRTLDDGSEMVAPPMPVDPTPEQLRERFAFNLNTCHVWAEDGEMFAAIDRGEEMRPPASIVERLEALGRDPAEWRSRMHGASGPLD